MSIWKKNASLEQVNSFFADTLCQHLGIVVTDIGADYIKGTMPVDARTVQHMGIIHGGSSVALAETLGSIGANLACDDRHYCVGLDINANHIRAGNPPEVIGIARPQHIGISTMVWEIKIHDRDDKLVCVSRLTTAVLPRNKAS